MTILIIVQAPYNSSEGRDLETHEGLHISDIHILRLLEWPIHNETSEPHDLSQWLSIQEELAEEVVGAANKDQPQIDASPNPDPPEWRPNLEEDPSYEI